MWRLVGVSIALLALAVTLVVHEDVIPEAAAYELPSPLPAPLEPNTVLKRARRLTGLLAPEGFAEAPAPGGHFVFMSLQDGRIARMHVLASDDWEPSIDGLQYVARTGLRSVTCDNYTYATELACGRPLGMLWHESGLIVADSYHGLMRVSRQQALAANPRSTLQYEPELLVAGFEGRPLMFANAIAASPTDADIMQVFFTESSTVYHRRDVLLCIYDARATGRLFRFNLRTREVTLLASQLGFPNGIIAHGDRLLVALTRDASVAQFSANVPHAARAPSTLFARNLPCLPDNIVHYEAHGLIAIGCAALRTQPRSLIDILSGRPWLRRLLLRVFAPASLLKLAPKFGAVVLLDAATGATRGSWNDEGSSVIDVVSEAHLTGRWIFLGSWRNPWLSVLRADEVFTK